jgi:disulfide bond formation protein DsbB
MSWPGRRACNALGLLACAALLGYAWYAQRVMALEPCPLCIFQRVGIAATGALFLLAALHQPRGWGAGVYGTLILVMLLATLAVAARHLWIQHLPPGSVPSCGATLDYLLEVFPLSDVIRKVLSGSGECAKVSWTFLGLSMPGWVAVAAVLLGALDVRANFLQPRSLRSVSR